MKIILASNNKNKMREFRELLAGTDAEPISQRDAGCDFEVDETGTTFEENAFLKADAVLKVTGCIAVADDSGLVVDALNGEPGIYSARYGFGHDASDADRNRYLLGKLGDEKNRRARFVCCVLLPAGRQYDNCARRMRGRDTRRAARQQRLRLRSALPPAGLRCQHGGAERRREKRDISPRQGDERIYREV